jgi:pimeloyl-ACP methyl ester carboxylesterase
LFQHAFDVLFKGCTAEPRCNALYPHLQTLFYRLVSELNKKPIMFQLQTGNHSPVRLTGNDLMNWLFSALYNTYLIPQLPGVICQISRQDYAQLSLLYGQGLYLPMSLGMFYSVMCSEDMAYTTPQALAASVHVMVPELQAGMLASLQGYYRTCQSWNVKPVSAVQKKPVTSSIPTLIMEGEYDPVTPPANGMLAAQTLSRSFFVLFPGLSHDLQTANPCPIDIENAFLDHPTEKPGASCISSMQEPVFL